MDIGLTREQRGWVARAELLAKEFATRARQYDEAAAFPAENFAKLRQEGFLTLGVPHKYGGQGVDDGYPDFLPLLVAEAVAAGCGSTGWNLQTHYEHCGLVFRMGNEAQHRRIFRDVIEKGSLLGSLGSEVNPEQLTAPQDTATRFTVGTQLTPVPGGLRANGMKHFCSVTPAAGYGMLWGMAPGTSSMADGLVLCVVPTDSPGLTLLDSGWKDCIGLRASVSWSAKLENLFVPWDNVLGQPGDFVQKDPYTFELAYTAVTLGVAQGAFDFLIGFIKERPYLLKDDTVAYVVGEMDSALQATRTSVRYAHGLWAEERHAEAQLASIRALHSARETALLITNKGFEVCGTRSLFKFHPLERAWRDVRALTLHTRESQLMRLLMEGRLSDDFQSKQKYGPRLEKRKSWADLGVLAQV
jgi:alkylation response protein AidB-like acyl-CoA dehydrogenase